MMGNKLTLDGLRMYALDLSQSAIFQILVLLILFDILTGVAKAVINKNINSKISTAGLIKHATILVLSTVIGIYARVLGVVGVSQTFVLGFIASYGISLLENLEAIGVPMPKGLEGFFEQMGNREFKINNADLIVETCDTKTAEILEDLDNSEETTNKSSQ